MCDFFNISCNFINKVYFPQYFMHKELFSLNNSILFSNQACVRLNHGPKRGPLARWNMTYPKIKINAHQSSINLLRGHFMAAWDTTQPNGDEETL